MLKKLVAIFLLLINLVNPGLSFADEKFYTTSDTTYKIEPDGNTNVQMEIGLKNKFDSHFASGNTITLGFDDISNVKASDPKGAIAPTVIKTVEGNSIELSFNAEVIGKDKTLNFDLSFDTPNVASKKGNIWRVDIPGLHESSIYDEFSVTVDAPKSFGKPSYIKPETGNSDLTFTKDELGQSGVSIGFGDHQVYGFDLVYHLRNTNLFPVITEIALPPSTNYQDVQIDDIEPKPLNIYIDEDGNWLAKYKLFPQKNIDVKVKGKSVTYIEPKKSSLSDEDRKEYLKEDKYWEVNDPEIQKLAKTLKTPEAIYNYVVSTLKYDFSKVEENERLGAKAALSSKDSAVCLEFTDLFIALSRAAGIPAREVDGYAYTENSDRRPLSFVQDILHAWPEYYDDKQGTWIMVDPTWGNTTDGIDYFHVLDFDHVAFVKRGVQSDYPVPAGGYKYEEDLEKKDVNIYFPAEFTMASPTAEISLDNNQLYTLFPLKANLLIKNTSKVALNKQKISISSSELGLNQEFEINEIPPYSDVILPVTIPKQGILTNSEYQIKILYNNQEFVQILKISPFFLSPFVIIGGGIIIVIASITVFIIARHRRRLRISRPE